LLGLSLFEQAPEENPHPPPSHAFNVPDPHAKSIVPTADALVLPAPHARLLVPTVQVPPISATFGKQLTVAIHHSSAAHFSPPPPHAPYPPPLPASFFRDNMNAMICDKREHLKRSIHVTKPIVVAAPPVDKMKKSRMTSSMTTRAASGYEKLVKKFHAAKAIQRLWRAHVQKQIALNDIDAVDFYEDESFDMYPLVK
jgi:hypothetical protein